MTHSFPTRRYSDLTGKRVSLSSEANHGLCQLINYIDRSARSQAYLRDDLKLAGFREPREVLMIGTEEESRDERVREFKGAWNRMNPRVQIRSYSALLRQLAAKVADHARPPRACPPATGRAARKRGGEGKRVSVRLDLGGPR